ncbi:MAG: protein-L-isoaspartate(D-aspartate) O-methyltransferase [Pseudomonadota bacterium]
MKAKAGENLVSLLLRLRGHGLDDAALFSAIEKAPHDQFVPVMHYERAWQDGALPIACGQTMPSPDLTARMVSALGARDGHTVLEIGTGSGYQTALLAQFAKKVVTLDRFQTMLSHARQRHEALGLTNITYHQQDGRPEVVGQGLYDSIVVDSCFTTMPRGLLEILVSGGVVICALGEVGSEQMVVRLTKIGSRFERENLFPVRLSPLEEGVAQAL